MKHTDIIKAVKKKDLKPVYFLHGDEPFFIDEITKAFENDILSESEKSFNFTVLYGKETEFKSVVDNARRFPMMAPLQVVILKEAQEMKSLVNLKSYVENPSKTTVLLICHKHKKYDMRTALGKVLKKNAEVFEAKRLYDNQVPDWIRDLIVAKGFKIQGESVDMLAEFLGTDLSRISNEVEKLSLNLEKGAEITKEVIEKNVGISKDFNVFELQEALGKRDSLKAHRIVNHFAANPRKHPLVVSLSSLYGFYSKLYIAAGYASKSDLEMAKAMGFTFRDDSKAKYAAKFRVAKFRASLRYFNRNHIEQVFAILKEFDLKSKGINNAGTPGGELLKELVIRILAV